jgi:hypothetical protein
MLCNPISHTLCCDTIDPLSSYYPQQPEATTTCNMQRIHATAYLDQTVQYMCKRYSRQHPPCLCPSVVHISGQVHWSTAFLGQQRQALLKSQASVEGSSSSSGQGQQCVTQLDGRLQGTNGSPSAKQKCSCKMH